MVILNGKNVKLIKRKPFQIGCFFKHSVFYIRTKKGKIFLDYSISGENVSRNVAQNQIGSPLETLKSFFFL